MELRDVGRGRGKDDEAGLLGSSFTFMRVRGIPIGAHWSWVFVFALVAWSLATALFPREYPDLSGRTYLIMGVVAAVVFFLSIVLHELGHALRALREGMKIRAITLWLFGGVARFEGMFPTAGAEFRIAIAGPVVSVFLAGLFLLAAAGARSADLPEAVTGVLSYLGRINAIVVAFNLVPALPLDGGRVLRAWLWHRQRSFTAATVSAARAGKGFAYMLITLGILSFFTQAVTGGIWFVFLGWFLLQAAQAEVAFVFVRQAFRGVKMRDLMTSDPETVSPDTTIEELLGDIARTRGHSTYPVVESGHYRGMISLRMAGAVEPSERETKRVRDVMVPAEETTPLNEDDSVLDGLEVLRSGTGRTVVLNDRGSVAGILSMSDIAKALELEQIRGISPEPAQRRAGLAVWIVVVVAIFGAGAAFYHPPLALVAPGPAVDVSQDITIQGADVTAVNGRYLLLSVTLARPSGLEAIMALFRSDQDLLPLARILPEGVDEDEFVEQQRDLFSESQMLAAAAAAQQAGLEVGLLGNGAVVAGTVPGSPAEGELREGDVIIAIDGSPVRLASDLRQVTTQQPAGTTFRLQVDRDGSTIEVEIGSARFETGDGATTGLGVFVTTRDFNVDLPFEITFREREIGGPSAGLIYALAIADMLQQADLANGRVIAATGTINAEGNVGPVGGIPLKLRSAQRAGASVALVPTEEVSQAEGARLRVRGVESLSDAVAALQAA